MAGDFALYRYFDREDRLLYIGISGDLAMRDTTHISRSRWMVLTARSAIERHSDLGSLKAAERTAIETEHPIFNVQYNDTPEAKARLVAYLTEIGRTDLLSSRKRPGDSYRGHSLAAQRSRLTPPPLPRGLAEENGLPFFAPASCTDRGEACVRRDVQDGCFGDSGPGYCVYGDVPGVRPADRREVYVGGTLGPLLAGGGTARPWVPGFVGFPEAHDLAGDASAEQV